MATLTDARITIVDGLVRGTQPLFLQLLQLVAAYNLSFICSYSVASIAKVWQFNIPFGGVQVNFGFKLYLESLQNLFYLVIHQVQHPL